MFSKRFVFSCAALLTLVSSVSTISLHANERIKLAKQSIALGANYSYFESDLTLLSLNGDTTSNEYQSLVETIGAIRSQIESNATQYFGTTDVATALATFYSSYDSATTAYIAATLAQDPAAQLVAQTQLTAANVALITAVTPYIPKTSLLNNFSDQLGSYSSSLTATIRAQYETTLLGAPSTVFEAAFDQSQVTAGVSAKLYQLLARAEALYSNL